MYGLLGEGGVLCLDCESEHSVAGLLGDVVAKGGWKCVGQAGGQNGVCWEGLWAALP